MIAKLRDAGHDSVSLAKEMGVPEGYAKGKTLVMLPDVSSEPDPLDLGPTEEPTPAEAAKAYTVAALRPLLDKGSITTVEDVRQAFKDGTLTYGDKKYVDLPDKTSADEKLQAGLPDDSKIVVGKDGITVTTKSHPLTDAQRAENATKAADILTEAHALREEAEDIRKNGLPPEWMEKKWKGVGPMNEQQIKWNTGNEAAKRDAKAATKESEARTLAGINKTPSIKHQFWFDTGAEQAAIEAAGKIGDPLYLNRVKKHAPEAVIEGQKMLARLAKEDKDFGKNPTFTVVDTGAGGLRLEFKVKGRSYSIFPEVVNIDRNNGELPISGNPIKAGDTIHLSPGFLDNKSEKVYLIPYGGEGTTFYDITSIVPLALKELAKLTRAGKEALPHLETLARATVHEGADRWQEFAKSMKQKLGELWDRFKGMVHEVFQRVKRLVSNDIGTASTDLQRDLARRHNDALDKVDAAIAAKDPDAAEKWLARADEIAAQWDKLNGEDAYDRGPEPEVGSGVEPGAAGVGEPQEAQQAPEASDSDDAPPPGRQTSIKNAVTTEESGPQDKWTFTHPELIEMGNTRMADPLFDPRQMAVDIMNNPRLAVSIQDVAGMAVDRMKIHNEYEAMKELRHAAIEAKNAEGIATSQLQLARLEDALAANSQAMDYAGTSWSAIGHIRQAMVQEDYSAIWLMNRAQAITGKRDITDTLRKELELASDRIAKLETALQKSIADAAAIEAQKAVQRISNDESTTRRRGKRQASREENEAKFHSLGEKLRAVLSPYKLNLGFDPEVVAILTDMARLRIENGITKAKDIVDDIYEELQGDYAFEKRDIQDAISGYGKTFEMSKDEIDVALREIKRQLKLISALEDAQRGISPEKSGLQHDPQSQEVHRLRGEVKQAMKASGIDSKSAIDPETQWKTTLDAAKTRLKNEILDLDRQIAAGKRDATKKTGVQYDQEALRLKEIRDLKKQALDEIDAKPGVSAQRRVEIALDAINRQIEEYQRRLKTHDLGAKPKPAAPDTPAIRRQRAVLADLKAAYEQMKKDAAPPKVPKTQEELDAMHLKAYRTRLEKRLQDYQNKLATGNFNKQARRTLKLDPETEKAKAAVQQAKERVEARMRALAKENRTGMEKAIDFGVKLQRATILSGTGILWKIGSASLVGRPVQTIFEEMAGSGLRLLPPLRMIMDKAPREGNGISVRAEATAFVQWFKREQYRNFWDRIKQGKDSIQLRYGKKGADHLQTWGTTKAEHAEYLLDLPGRAHSALKSIAYTQEFYRSLQYRTEYAIRNNWDLTDPKVQLMLKVAAEGDANRIQFMGDSWLNTTYRISLARLRSAGPFGYLASAGVKANLPITKVPVNYVGELMSFIPPIGAGKTLATIAKGYVKAGKPEEAREYLSWALFKKAVDNMDEEEAEYATRAMKKQVLGTIPCLIVGYYAYKHFGGFYKKGEKRKLHDLKPGEIQVDGINFSDKLFHTPVFDAFQMYAMVHHVEDLENNKEAKHPEGEKKTVVQKKEAGMLAAGMGELEKVPYIGTPARIYQAAQSYEGTSDYVKRLVESILIPPDVQQFARNRDKAGDVVIPRKGGLSAEIPGIRKSLPVDMNKVKRMQLDQLAEIMEHGPGKVKEQVLPEFKKKFIRARGLTDEERKRYWGIFSDSE